MKKLNLGLLTLLVLAMVSCEKPLIDGGDGCGKHHGTRNPAETAIKARKQIYGRDASRSDLEIIAWPNSRSDDDKTIYIVNFENEEGYCLVPASTAGPEILAITEKGSLKSLENNEIPGLQLLLDNAISTMSAGDIFGVNNFHKWILAPNSKRVYFHRRWRNGASS